jgi:hypothetical protein
MSSIMASENLKSVGTMARNLRVEVKMMKMSRVNLIHGVVGLYVVLGHVAVYGDWLI